MLVEFKGYRLALRRWSVSLHRQGAWYFGLTLTSKYGASNWVGRVSAQRAVFVRW